MSALVAVSLVVAAVWCLGASVVQAFTGNWSDVGQLLVLAPLCLFGAWVAALCGYAHDTVEARR